MTRLLIAVAIAALLLSPRPVAGQDRADLVLLTQGPDALAPGQTGTFKLTVGNPGGAAAQQVVLRCEVPAGLEYRGRSGGFALKWNLGTLAPRKHREFRVQLKASSTGDHRLVTKVLAAGKVVGSRTHRTAVARPGPSALHVSSYDTEDPVPVGGTTTYVIEVRNEGEGPIGGVTVASIVPVNMEFVGVRGPSTFEAKGQSIRFAPLGKLGAGEKAVFKVECRALRAGPAVHQTIVTAGGASFRKGEPTVVDVPSPSLHVSSYDTEDPAAFFRATVHVVEVRNEGKLPARNVVVRIPENAGLPVTKAEGPEGTTFKNGVFTPYASLAPGQKLIYKIHARGRKPGLVAHRAIVTAYAVPAVTVEEPVRVLGVAALHVSTYDTEDPVEVGGQTVYVVEVRNEGTKDATAIDVACRIPKEMAYVAAAGPGAGKHAGGVVRFPRIAKLAPGDKLTFKVTCKTTAGGSAKFTTTVRYAEFAREILDEEGTSTYR